MSLTERVQSAMQGFTNGFFGAGTEPGVAADLTKGFYKAVVPNFLYKPPFGFPLNKDVPEIRRLAKSPYVDMIIRTIAAEIASLEWQIVAKDGVEIPEEIIEQTQQFFYNPNSNDESLDYFLRAFVRDLLEVDAGVIEKVYNGLGEFVEMYVRDGGTFTKNPNLHGVLPQSFLDEGSPYENLSYDSPIGRSMDNTPYLNNDSYAYYQYGWLTGSRPIPFDRREISYAILNPRSDSIYGMSPVEVLQDVLQLLIYGIDSNLEYFEDNNIPKGIFKMVGASSQDIQSFGEMWREQLRKKDPSGKWRKKFHKMPISNKEGEFVRVAFSNLELELLEQQKWFTKIVWACFGITPSELGFTEDSNRATEVVQSAVGKRKTIAPIVRRIEYHFNTDIINSLPWIKGTQWENKVLFDFNKFDLQEELAKRQLYWGDIKAGLMTKNEIREELNLEPLEGGDELPGAMNPFMLQNTDQFDKKEENIETEADKKTEEEKSLDLASPLAIGPFEEMTPDQISALAKKELNESKKKIKALLEREAGNFVISEIKALDIGFTRKLAALVSIDSFKEAMAEAIRWSFFAGMDKVGTAIGMNVIPNQAAVKFLEDHTFENINGMEDELKQDLRAELQRGLINRESPTQLTKRVDKIFKDGWNRAAMISRTELNRAKNYGELDAYRQSGKAVIKEWYNPIAEAPVCVKLAGTKIPINDFFEYEGKVFDAPPAHPNCRSQLKFYLDGEDDGPVN